MVEISVLVSPVFHKFFIFDGKEQKKKIKKIIKDTKRFEKFFRKYEKRIIKMICRYCGGKFGDKEIIVWVFTTTNKKIIPSISDPLLLKYRKNYYFMVYVLIHELVHRFFSSDKKYKKSKNKWLKPEAKRQEALAHLVAKKIFFEIFGKKISEEKFERFDNIVTKNNTKVISNKIGKRWNLNKKPLKFFLRI
jgi:hypothetical protein